MKDERKIALEMGIWKIETWKGLCMRNEYYISNSGQDMQMVSIILKKNKRQKDTPPKKTPKLEMGNWTW